jgi:hypothetical protein
LEQSEKLGKMGYKLVEAAGYSDGKFYGMTPAEFKALCNKKRLKLFLVSYWASGANQRKLG